MQDEPQFASVAALIGDPARASMLAALLNGRALTASELAAVAGVALPTASGHLARLEAAGLLASIRQGRNRYFRIAAEDVAHTLETLMLLAERTGARRVRTGPRDPALREARVCYDHLAGSRGVQMLESLVARGHLARADGGLEPSAAGERFLGRLGLDVGALGAGRRALCVGCLDWSERREHLAGALGAALLGRMQALGWLDRERASRVVRFTPKGLAAFERTFPPRPPQKGA